MEIRKKHFYKGGICVKSKKATSLNANISSLTVFLLVAITLTLETQTCFSCPMMLELFQHGNMWLFVVLNKKPGFLVRELG